MMKKRLLPKPLWAKAIGASLTCKRLHLLADADDLYFCPVPHCDNERYLSQRGCRKHVYNRHGWFYFFGEKPNIKDCFPEQSTRARTYLLRKRTVTSYMPIFLPSCRISLEFKKRLTSPGGGGKSEKQAYQINSK